MWEPEGDSPFVPLLNPLGRRWGGPVPRRDAPSSGPVTVPALRPRKEEKKIPVSRNIQKGPVLWKPDLNFVSRG